MSIVYYQFTILAICILVVLSSQLRHLFLLAEPKNNLRLSASVTLSVLILLIIPTKFWLLLSLLFYFLLIIILLELKYIIRINDQKEISNWKITALIFIILILFLPVPVVTKVFGDNDSHQNDKSISVKNDPRQEEKTPMLGVDFSLRPSLGNEFELLPIGTISDNLDYLNLKTQNINLFSEYISHFDRIIINNIDSQKDCVSQLSLKTNVGKIYRYLYQGEEEMKLFSLTNMPIGNPIKYYLSVIFSMGFAAVTEDIGNGIKVLKLSVNQDLPKHSKIIKIRVDSAQKLERINIRFGNYFTGALIQKVLDPTNLLGTTYNIYVDTSTLFGSLSTLYLFFKGDLEDIHSISANITITNSSDGEFIPLEPVERIKKELVFDLKNRFLKKEIITGLNLRVRDDCTDSHFKLKLEKF